MKHRIFLLITLGCFFVAQSQENDKESFIRMEIYKNVAENIESPSLYKRISDYYYFNNQLKDAKKWYSKLMDVKKIILDPEYYYRYAQVLKNLGYYSESDQMMINFRESTSKLFQDLYAEDFDLYMEKQAGRYIVANEHKINTPYREITPNYYLGNLLYASTKDVLADLSEANIDLSGNSNPPTKYDLFVAKISNTRNKILKKRKLRNSINSILHESSPVLSSDGNTMYFTRSFCGREAKASGKCLLRIFRAIRKDGQSWGSVEELPFNSPDYSCAHPTISTDGKYLYFASNMDDPKSEENTDIYVVPIDSDGGFTEKPSRVVGINTKYKETTPFIGNNGYIYIASTGYKGLGGMDLFGAKLLNPYEVEKVYNLGPDINSKYDDFGMIFDVGSKHGYFVSDKLGGAGKEDIYSFIEIRPLLNDCHTNIVGVVSDQETGMPLTNVTVELIDDKNNILERTTVDDLDGTFRFSSTACNSVYFTRVYRKGYITTEKLVAQSVSVGVSTSLVEVEMEKTDMDIPQDVFVSYKGNAVVTKDVKGEFFLDPIYFDLGSSVLRGDARRALDKLARKLSEEPDTKIQVLGHTDSRGGEAKNLKLSEDRALSTFRYLVIRGGISPNRISIKCLGETAPVNDCADGEDCTEAQYKLNRRSEFIKSLDSKDITTAQ